MKNVLEILRNMECVEIRKTVKDASILSLLTKICNKESIPIKIQKQNYKICAEYVLRVYRFSS